MKNITPILILIAVLNAFTFSAIAQNNEADNKDSVSVMNWLSRNFVFEKPDTGFIALTEGNGYRNNSLDATIKYLSFPENFEKIQNQFANKKSTKTSLVIDTLRHKVNESEAFSVITEEISPDKSKYENYIIITTLVDFREITVCIVGAYPKSKDKLLQEKYIKAALTIKEE